MKEIEKNTKVHILSRVFSFLDSGHRLLVLHLLKFVKLKQEVVYSNAVLAIVIL